MTEFKIEHKFLKKILETIMVFEKNDVKLNFTEKGINITKIDDGRIAIYILDIDKGDLVDYKMDDVQTFNMNITDLSIYIKKFKFRKTDNSLLEFSFHTDNCYVIADGIKKNFPNFTMGTDNVKPEALTKLEYKIQFQNLNHFGRFIDKTNKDYTIRILLKENLSLSSGLTQFTDLSMNKVDGLLVNDEYGEIDLIFACSYLKKFKAIYNSESVLYLKFDTPLKIVNKLGLFSNVVFYLAPRAVEKEEDD
jgi:hypothetical protein